MLELILPLFFWFFVGATPAPLEPVVLDAEPLPEPVITEPAGKFLTAAEVKPILQMTEGNWVAIRDFAGQDFVYFTHLLAWRCGLSDIRYAINDAADETSLEMEPCYPEGPSPSAMTDVETYPIYITLPPGSVETIRITLTYDDGTTQTVSFERAEILLPG